MNAGNRGMAGMDESLSFRIHQLAGAVAPNTNYLHSESLTTQSRPRRRTNIPETSGGSTFRLRKSMVGFWMSVISRMAIFIGSKVDVRIRPKISRLITLIGRYLPTSLTVRTPRRGGGKTWILRGIIISEPVIGSSAISICVTLETITSTMALMRTGRSRAGRRLRGIWI